jgi:ABC-type nickel/cobalt efflux system permease component RcnA
MKVSFCLCAVLAVTLLNAAGAHPVPRRNHDRTIVVRLGADPESGQLAIWVHYRLEVDEYTALYEDLLGLGQKIDLSKLTSPRAFYELYTQTYAPILAANLAARVDDQPLEFSCIRQEHGLRDENGQPLGHLRCDFVFYARAGGSSKGEEPKRFAFREGNYEFEDGLIRVSLAGDDSVRFFSKVEADEALKTRPSTQWKPGDEAKLRAASAEFAFTAITPTSPRQVQSSQAVSTQVDENTSAGEHSLLALLLDSRQGFWVLMFLAAVFGAAHALTPGHGKTLVAAYLVGERGTTVHALILGLVTTATHTGAVLLLAALLLFSFPQAVPHDVQLVLGLVGGLLVAALGLWLLLRRLSGGPDHVHIGGGHRHHHHGHRHSDHYHDEHGHVHPLPAVGGPVGWWGLVVLGVSGGIIPCWDAILMLGFAISAQRLWLGIPLLLAFSAGLAGVLIAIGIAVVYLKGFASSRWGESRLVRLLPVMSAVLVTCMGLWLCYDSTRPEAAPREPPAQSRP